MKIQFLFLFVIAACTGCSTTGMKLRDTPGATGCPKNEIVLSEETRTTWVATCRGKRFQCSANNYEVRCKEELR